jgi:hypothetical protein
LANQGTWIKTDDYGYVWQPTESDPNWRPYTYGHWVNTDQGMTWVSDESFGWATYHYGRWTNLDGYGWVWVPGYTWAPAWVSWRTGTDDVGWAPLPPDSDEGIDYYDDGDDYADYGYDGFHIGDDCDLAYGIGPGWYNFCPIVFIGDRDCWRHFHNRNDNFALVNHTRNVTNINFRRDGAGRFGHVTAEGPSVAALNARARTTIPHVGLAAAMNRENAGLRGNMLSVFAPKIDPSTVRNARPNQVTQNMEGVSVNRGTDINRPLAVNSRIAPTSATADQVRAATEAQNRVPAESRIATDNTRISHPLTQPLTSLRANTGSFNATHNFGGDGRFAGESVVHQGAFRSPAYSSYGGISPTYHSFAPAYHPQSSFRVLGPGAYVSSPAYYHSQFGTPAFHSSGGGYYHPQGSFYPSLSGSHVGGGAPATHFSGGGFSGGGHAVGGFSGGGGHAGGGFSGGGGHAGGGGHR